MDEVQIYVCNNIRNTEEAVFRPQYSPRLGVILTKAHRATVSIMAKGCILA